VATQDEIDRAGYRAMTHAIEHYQHRLFLEAMIISAQSRLVDATIPRRAHYRALMQGIFRDAHQDGLDPPAPYIVPPGPFSDGEDGDKHRFHHFVDDILDTLAEDEFDYGISRTLTSFDPDDTIEP
jgi:hypothetical protein